MENNLRHTTETATEFTLHFLQHITDNFSEKRIIGRGGYGIVYKGVLENRDEIAVKKLGYQPGLGDDQFKNEVINLMGVEHQNIVRLLGYCYETRNKVAEYNGKLVFAGYDERVLCFEYLQGGSLEKYVSDGPCRLDWSISYGIIKGICDGLKHLHTASKNPIYHLDLKPANILLDEDMIPKIGDFGLSRLLVSTQTCVTQTFIGTHGYMPPEYIDKREITPKFDVFSLGVIILQIMAGRSGHSESAHTPSEQFIEIVHEKWRKRLQATMSADISQEVKICIEIALKCVESDRVKRPTINQIVDELDKIDNAKSSSTGQGLHALTVNSTSERFSSLPGPSSARGPLDVVIVYAFDCSTWTSAWYAVDDGVFWMVQEKLAKFTDSCMGYIYAMLSGNTYTCDMKIVDPAETRATGYTGFARRRVTCSKNMASGLSEAHKMINNRGYENGIILLFSDGLENKGDFFDGAENFRSKVPVHTFTFDGDAYNKHVLHSIAENSPGGKFHTNPVPERPLLSIAFSKLLDNIFGGCPKDDEKPPSPISGRGPLDVVMVYAFDCTDSTSAWHTVDNGVFWLLQEKLTHFPDSCMGYIYVMSSPNKYTSDMKLVDSAETRETGYTGFARRRMDCTKNMASGLPEAHKMIRSRGIRNGIILFFSDGLINRGDFFDGTENFRSKVPVHTFTLGGDAYNQGLQDIAAKSPGGTFNPLPVPERPQLSAPFSKLLDRLLGGTMKD